MKPKRPMPSTSSSVGLPAAVRVEDSSGQQVAGLWIKVVIVVGVAVFIGVKMRMNWILDMNDPEFNPLTFMVLGLAGYGLVTAGQAVWLGRKTKRFGKAVLQLSGDGVARLGRTVDGVIITEKPLAGSGVVKVTLRCVDRHLFKDSDIGSRDDVREFVTWESSTKVPLPGLDATGTGIPFQFQLPNKVGEEARPRDPNGIQFKFKGALMIPGMKRRIWTHGVEPAAQAWRLEAKGETENGPFRVVFEFPVQQP